MKEKLFGFFQNKVWRILVGLVFMMTLVSILNFYLIKLIFSKKISFSESLAADWPWLLGFAILLLVLVIFRPNRFAKISLTVLALVSMGFYIVHLGKKPFGQKAADKGGVASSEAADTADKRHNQSKSSNPAVFNSNQDPRVIYLRDSLEVVRAKSDEQRRAAEAKEVELKRASESRSIIARLEDSLCRINNELIEYQKRFDQADRKLTSVVKSKENPCNVAVKKPVTVKKVIARKGAVTRKFAPANTAPRSTTGMKIWASKEPIYQNH